MNYADLQKHIPEMSLETLRALDERALAKGCDVGLRGWSQTPFSPAETVVQDGLSQGTGTALDLQIQGHEDQPPHDGLGPSLLGPADMPAAILKLGEAGHPLGDN